MKSPQQSVLAERLIERILKGGVIGSVFFMIIGLVLLTIHQNSVVPPAERPSLSYLITNIFNPSAPERMAFAFMVVGLLLLMFTPFLRVMATVLVFLAERELKYVAVALLVLLMLIGEVIFAFR